MDGELCLAGYAILSDCDDTIEWAEEYDEYANSLLRGGSAGGEVPSMSYVSDAGVESIYAAMVEDAAECARDGMTDFVESWSQWRLAQNQHSKYEPLLGADGGRDRLLACYRAAAKVVQAEVNRRF